MAEHDFEWYHDWSALCYRRDVCLIAVYTQCRMYTTTTSKVVFHCENLKFVRTALAPDKLLETS
jgi:hypothetical protein